MKTKTNRKEKKERKKKRKRIDVQPSATWQMLAKLSDHLVIVSEAAAKGALNSEIPD